jgi:hypothetical protein
MMFAAWFGGGFWSLRLDHWPDGSRAQVLSLAPAASDFTVSVVFAAFSGSRALIAERFSPGRIFLAGDAAHTLQGSATTRSRFTSRYRSHPAS